MGVISITEDTRDQSANLEVDELDYLISLQRKFDIIFSSDTDPVAMPIYALDVISVSGSDDVIPVQWESHPYDEWAYVVRKSARSKGGYNWEVICYYERQEEPFLTPYRLSYGWSTVTESIDKDIDGLPITNSSLETPDPPLQEEYTDFVLHFDCNWETIDEAMMADYGKAVNSDVFRGHAPGTCLIQSIDANEVRIAGLTYYAVTIEIHVRPGGWKRRYLDEGYRIVVKDSAGNPETNSDGNIKFETIVGEDGLPLTAPVLLDGTGSRLADGANPVFLERKTKKERPFSVLNLGL